MQIVMASLLAENPEQRAILHFHLEVGSLDYSVQPLRGNALDGFRPPFHLEGLFFDIDGLLCNFNPLRP